MTLARTWSVGLVGVQGAMVEIEVDLSSAVPQVVLVGLPDAVVRQSVDRVKAAIANVGDTFPYRKITISLSPASMPKQGSGFDLALAAAVLAAAGTVPDGSVDRLVLLGLLESARFFQQNAPEHVPDGVRVAEVATEDEPAAPRIIGGDPTVRWRSDAPLSMTTVRKSPRFGSLSPSTIL